MINIFRTKKSAQKEWKVKTLDFAKKVNLYVEKGLKHGWEEAGSVPEDNGREKLVSYLLKEIREANTNGDITKLRENWPLAHSPMIPELESNGQSIPVVAILDDERVVARIGAFYEEGYVVEIDDLSVKPIDGIRYFGRSPNKKLFAYCKDNGVSVTEGWLGREVSFFSYPTGLESVPPQFDVKAFETPPRPSQLIPFPDGNKVLFVSSQGIFVLSHNENIRLLPTKEDLVRHFEWMQTELPDRELTVDLSMAHGAISPDGRFIAIGEQYSTHRIFDANYNLIGDIGNLSEYAHYAIFSKHSDMIALNSCHFYNGISIGFSTSHLPDFKTEPYEDNEDTPILQDGARVYAGVHRHNEFIIGDAYGYLRAFSENGELHWQHYIGANIGDIDISSDESKLVCSTCAGYISIIELDTGKRKEYEIGTGGHTEFRRWLFWKNEDKPLAW
ncbi:MULTISPECIES: hypothetical protein [unclassified Pseudoalteromonas]|uniref:hypothetical protein n=1 Tax=unclassified Pseudoalteromonas TaxID=194690 RepID=UPI002096DD78|nr:hypothetical protein [Pseudoalteromonas sp. XMcav2-N]MCO7187744.1 hypothetical protein [Pseudoalteromonas sp. XMcav2-N]